MLVGNIGMMGNLGMEGNLGMVVGMVVGMMGNMGVYSHMGVVHILSEPRVAGWWVRLKLRVWLFITFIIYKFPYVYKAIIISYYNNLNLNLNLKIIK